MLSLLKFKNFFFSNSFEKCILIIKTECIVEWFTTVHTKMHSIKCFDILRAEKCWDHFLIRGGFHFYSYDGFSGLSNVMETKSSW